MQSPSLYKAASHSQYALHTLATHFTVAYSLFTIRTHKAQDSMNNHFPDFGLQRLIALKQLPLWK